MRKPKKYNHGANTISASLNIDEKRKAELAELLVLYAKKTTAVSEIMELIEKDRKLNKFEKMFMLYQLGSVFKTIAEEIKQFKKEKAIGFNLETIH